MHKELILSSLLVATHGCAITTEGLGGATSGMSTYKLESPNCKVEVASGKDAAEAEIELTEGCGVRSKLKGVTGQEAQMEMLNLLRDLVM